MPRLPNIGDCGCIRIEPADDRGQLRANVQRAVNAALRTRHRSPTQSDLAFAAGEVKVEERRAGRIKERQ